MDIKSRRLIEIQWRVWDDLTPGGDSGDGKKTDTGYGDGKSGGESGSNKIEPVNEKESSEPAKKSKPPSGI